MLTVSLVGGARDLRTFIDVPWRLLDGGRFPAWVPPLRKMVRDNLDVRRNPFYEEASLRMFIARRGGRVAGRIAAIENRAHNRAHGDTAGFYGFFECEDDPGTAGALFDAVADWLRSRGLESMRGPVSPSTNHETGLLVDGFGERSVFLTPWNPPYYVRLHERSGFRPAKDLLAYLLLASEVKLPEQVGRIADRARERGGIAFRDLDLSNFERDVEACWEIYNAAWEANWGFVPMSREEFWFQARDLEQLLVPRFGFVAEVDGVPAGFLLLLPDFNEAIRRIGNGRLFPTGWLRILRAKGRIRFGRVFALGLKPEFRTRSIFPLFVDEVYRRGIDYGMEGAEASWILEDNDALTSPLEKLGARVNRRWRIYEREL